MTACLLRLALILAAAPSLSAADRVWTGGGGDDNWSNPANWGGTAPLPGDVLFFGGSVRTMPLNNFPAGTPFNGITFDNPSGLFTLRGNAITLGGDIADLMPRVAQAAQLGIALNGDRNISVVADGLLTLSGSLSGAGANLTKTGAGQLTLAGTNTFSGAVRILGGTLAVAADRNLGAAPGTATPERVVINGGALRTTATFTLDPNRGIALGPEAGAGAGTFTVNSGTTLTYGGVIANRGSGSGGLTKNAFGGLTLSGANTYTGPTVIENGTMTLDFTPAGAPLNQIVSSSSPLTLGGANAGLGAASFAALTINGKPGVTDAQTFNGTTIDIGPAIIRANSGAGGRVELSLGALTHNPGGILNVVTPTATGGTGTVHTTTGNTHGILGGWATVGNGGVYRNITMGTDWASVDGQGHIVPFTGYRVFQTGESLRSFAEADTNLRINGASTGDVAVDTPGAGTVTDVNTINLSETRAFSLVIGDGNTLRLGRFGSIFKSDNANNITWALGSGTTGGGNGVQDSGTLTAGGAPDTPGEIVFYLNNNASQSQGSLNLEARITDNGSGSVRVVKAGPASMKLRGHNSFSGGLYLLQGRLQLAGGEIGTANPDGAGTGPIHVFPGAYLFPSGTGSVITNDCFIAGLGTDQEQVGAIRLGNGWTISGEVRLTGDSRLGGGSATTLPTTGISGRISGPFAFDIGALGTINTFITLSHPGNDWSGATTLNARNNNSANAFRNGTNDVIPHGVGKGNVTLNGNTSTGSIMWDLNGFNETINGLLSAGNLAGCIISNGLSGSTSTLTVGDNDQTATFGGILMNGAGGAGVVALTKIGGGRQTLTGVNTYTGPTTVNGGTLALGGAGSIASSQQIIVDGGTLDVSEVGGGFTYVNPVFVNHGELVVRNTTAPGIGGLTLSDARVRVTSLGATPVAIETATLATGGETNYIDIGSVGLISGYPAQFTIIKYSGFLDGVGFNFALGNVPTPNTVGYVLDNFANGSVDVVLLDGPKPLAWTGNANGAAWDVGLTTNWLAFGAVPTAFLDVDSVIFDDAGSSPTINLVTTVKPGAMIVSNHTINYTLVGAGKLSGSTGLTKEGTGTLVLANTGTNDFFGAVAINAGTVQVGNHDGNGSLGAGAVNNQANLVFARSDNATIANPITGPGTVTQNGTGTLTLSGDSGFTGPTVIARGTLRPGAATAFGTAAGSTAVNDGATLDVNGINLTAEPVLVSGAGAGGNGAIVNTGPAQLSALRTVTLLGDVVFGGTTRWDIRNTGGDASLSTGGQGYRITKVGPNQVSLVGVATIDPALGDIEIQEGVFSVQTTTAALGDPLTTITVFSGATLGLFNLNLNPLNKIITLREGATVFNENGNSAVAGLVILEGAATFNAAAAGTDPMLTFAGITGAGGFVKIGAGPVNVGGFNDYQGSTIVSNGTLIVDGSLLGGGAVVVAGGTLAGVGVIGGPVTLNGASRLSPGNPATPVGVLSIFNLVALGGTTVMDLEKTGGLVSSDLITGVETLTLAGTLQLNLSGEPLAAGDVFQLFSFIASSGDFTDILPATPGPGLSWDRSQLAANGTLRVTGAAEPPAIGSIMVSGGDAVISGTGGIAGATYHVLSSTNVTLPLMQWEPVGTNVFDGSGHFSFTNAVNPNVPKRFYLLSLP